MPTNVKNLVHPSLSFAFLVYLLSFNSADLNLLEEQCTVGIQLFGYWKHPVTGLLVVSELNGSDHWVTGLFVRYSGHHLVTRQKVR